MKYAVLSSGAFGFVVVAVAGFTAERPADLVLRDAALACLATAFLGRWFWGVLDRAFAETVTARRAAAEAAELAAEAAEAKQKDKTTSSPASAAPPPGRPAPSPRPAAPAAVSSR
jgi:hypothetical protein